MASLQQCKDQGWYFTKKQIENSPDRILQISKEDELAAREIAWATIEQIINEFDLDMEMKYLALIYVNRYYMIFPTNVSSSNTVGLSALVAVWCRTVNQCPIAIIKEDPSMMQHADVMNFRNTALEMKAVLDTNLEISNPYKIVLECAAYYYLTGNLIRYALQTLQVCLQRTAISLIYKPPVFGCFVIFLVFKALDLFFKDPIWYKAVDENMTSTIFNEIEQDFKEEIKSMEIISEMKILRSTIVQEVETVLLIQGETSIPYGIIYTEQEVNDESSSDLEETYYL